MPRRWHPTACSLPGVRLIEPTTQGDCDGLCGLYCIINAIRLVMAPRRELTRDETKALFRTGVRFLDRHHALPEALLFYVHERLWLKLAERLVAKAQDTLGRPIVLDIPSLPEDAPINKTLHRIERMIASGKVPCVFLRGKYLHYSVISSYTPLSLKLFDSFGYQRVLRRSCASREPLSHHRLHVQSLIALEVQG